MSSTTTTATPTQNETNPVVFPFPELWPVLPLEFVPERDNGNVCTDNGNNENEDGTATTDTTTNRTDKYGRVQCTRCRALFCCRGCYAQKMQEMGSCCVETKLLTDLPQILASSSSSSQQQQRPANDDDDDDDRRDDADRDGDAVDETTHKTVENHHDHDHDQEYDEQVQAPVVLAVILFFQLVHYYRTNHEHRSIDGHWIHRACGEARDIDELELGVSVRRRRRRRRTCDDDGNDDGNDDAAVTYCYTLQPVYEHYAIRQLHLDANERSILSLDLLHALASKAARNGFGMSTQSPFTPYYSALLRQSNYGGRQSTRHARHVQQLAHALIGKDFLERGMDREIDEQVAPEITAMFPLTMHCNHSCQPNAQVQSQMFADALIDVVAIRDIAVGEEICISYISGVGGDRRRRHCRRSTFQRQRELRAKYLFDCQCNECIKDE